MHCVYIGILMMQIMYVRAFHNQSVESMFYD